MARQDVRCKAQLPVFISVDEGEGKGLRKNSITSNLGLGGVFINSDFSLPENTIVRLKAPLPNGELDVRGKVLRKEENGVAVKFLDLRDEGKSMLQEYIQGHIETANCLFCRMDTCLTNPELENAESKTVQDQHVSLREKILDEAIESFMLQMRQIEDHIDNKQNDPVLLNETHKAIYELFDAFKEYEIAVNFNKELLGQKQLEFRNRTNLLLSKSYFVNHARTWPKGYQGDYKMLEAVYRNTPLSSGIGYFVDQDFLDSTLGVAVRHRLKKIKEILLEELKERKNPKILNIACGSCREIFELAADIETAGAYITGIDFDSDALDFAFKRFSYTNLESQLNFRKYNALRMVSHEKNLKEFGYQDIIYSLGFFDYLTDDVLIRMFSAFYRLLVPGGMFIAAFKDSDRYSCQAYHWFVDWHGFYQRTENQSKCLLMEAGIPANSISSVRDESGVIIFYLVTK